MLTKPKQGQKPLEVRSVYRFCVLPNFHVFYFLWDNLSVLQQLTFLNTPIQIAVDSVTIHHLLNEFCILLFPHTSVCMFYTVTKRLPQMLPAPASLSTITLWYLGWRGTIICCVYVWGDAILSFFNNKLWPHSPMLKRISPHTNH